ncbi:polymorphic toxin-type HINT domain-containing protein [Thalassomonas haliotis]|uniref:ParB N-terminal domain-containing protein n=1 Tax=Thalassomonas haliotis TaxID=485448 RepID=A0ABY7VC66_9GAMM|nr:polymorphic toxin-type HINT domain-containing protein [Thalassomonas haliotis]WDE10482.1 ParB N-terminal domain-containing protein [Thalassomonas haliotis]
MQARYYDPVIGRFYSNDPVGASNVHNFNRYAYANNNPYRYVDPDGRNADSVADAANELRQSLSPETQKDVAIAATAVMVGGTVAAALPAPMAASAALGSEVQSVATGEPGGSGKVKACCFVAGTQVLTEDGYKNIEDIKFGEKLWAKNVETGEQDWKPITKVFNEPDRGIYEIKLESHDRFFQKIQATDDHPFYVIGKGWKTTIELMIGDQIETDGHDSMTVISVIDEKRQDLTYNFTVADFHTYYVTKRNVLVHNCGDSGTRQMISPKNLVPTQSKAEMTGSKVKKLTKSMKKEGFVEGRGTDGPVSAVTNSMGKLEIENGHHRAQAAINAKIDKIPVEVY